jgi:hypothetical protein
MREFQSSRQAEENDIMDMYREREDRKSAGGWRRWIAAVAGVAVLAAVGCDGGLLDVDDPDIVTPDQLEGPDAVPLALAGMVGDFHEGFDEYVLYSSLFTDEAILAGTFPTRIDVDERNVVQTPGNGSVTVDIYQEMHVSRASADQLVANFEANLGSEEFAEVQGQMEEGIALGKYYGAYDRVLFAEMFCQSIFGGEDGEPAPLDSDARMQEALALFEEAEADAVDAGLDDVATAARVGQARAQLWLGNHADAAARVSEVPTGFVYTAEYSANQPAQNNEFFQFSWGVIERLRWTVGAGTETARHNEEYAYYDEWVDQGLIVPMPEGFDAAEEGLEVHLPRLYSQASTNAVLASGWEARMIEAEDELRNGDPEVAQADVNALLEDPAQAVNPMAAVNPGLTSSTTIGGVTAPAMGAFDAVDFTGDLESDLQQLARARAAGLWLSGQRQGTARRFAEEFGDPFGLGLYPPGTEGTDLFLPVVEQETDNNPNISSACP